ncbi:MAG: VWA domain-containing protein [Deltaproteobacteria bacterium]|nr:VWA domain-containing protein [Deltaproteobacteria bacterium]
MRLADTQLFWMLTAAVVPLLIIGIALHEGWRRRALRKIAGHQQLRHLADSVSHGRRLAKTVLVVLAIGLLIATTARLQKRRRTQVVKALGIDIVVALDFSKSMLARDAYPSRIERAKLELGRLIDGLKGDRLGLVAYAGETLSYPLTTDYTAAKIFWRDLGPNDMPIGGTAIGKALTAASRLLTGARKGKPRSQVILLLTDGEDNQSDPIAAAKKIAKLGIRIYTVGIGSHSGEVIPQLNEDGTIAGYQKDDKGSIVTTRLDAKTLKTVAELTKGQYIEIDPKRFGVEPVIAAIGKLQKSESKARLVRDFEDAPRWLLFPAFLLLLVGVCLPDRRWQKEGNG